MTEMERIKRRLDGDVAEFIKNTETVPITATATVTFTDSHENREDLLRQARQPTNEDDRADVLRYAVQSITDRNNIEQNKNKRIYIKPTSVRLK